MAEKILFNIAIVGTGNLSWHLARAIASSEHSLQQVLSRNKTRAVEFAKQVSAEGIGDIDELSANIDIVILAVQDSVLTAKYISQFPTNVIICHTSGSISMRVLNSHTNHGIFYPLQTFSKQKKLDFSNIPICLEANNSKVIDKLHILAHSLSQNIYKIDSKQRKALHLAAVFACNFTNLMYDISENLCTKEKLDFNILRPLIMETARKVQNHYPYEVQTGPAKRDDNKVIAAHKKLLNNEPDYEEIYMLLTNEIRSNNEEL